MPYHLFGLLHATAYSTFSRLRREDGQGTVEYVALVLLLAFLFAAVVKFVSDNNEDDHGIANKIITKIRESIDGVGDAPGKK